MTLYRSDGQTVTATIGTNKGAEADLQGTKNPDNPDRVVVYANMMSGQSYKVADVLSRTGSTDGFWNSRTLLFY